METQTLGEQQAALDELARGATTETDTREIHKWQDEIDEARVRAASDLGSAPMKGLVEVSGVVEEQATVQAAIDAGQDIQAGPYQNGQR